MNDNEYLFRDSLAKAIKALASARGVSVSNPGVVMDSLQSAVYHVGNAREEFAKALNENSLRVSPPNIRR